MDYLNNLVSVVIPTVNGREKLLKNAIESVRLQTYNPIELIVVNEGLKAPVQRNIGIMRANGHFIAFLDDDDTFMPTKIEKQMQVMNANPNCPLVICYMLDKRFGMERVQKPKLKSDFNDLIKSFNLSSTSSYLARKYPLELCGGFDPLLKSGQEYDVALNLGKYHNILCVPEVLAVQNASIGQISENWGNKIRGNMRIWFKWKKYYKLRDHLKMVGVLGLFFLGFFFGNRIYKIIIPVKKKYEGGLDG